MHICTSSSRCGGATPARGTPNGFYLLDFVLNLHRPLDDGSANGILHGLHVRIHVVQGEDPRSQRRSRLADAACLAGHSLHLGHTPKRSPDKVHATTSAITLSYSTARDVSQNIIIEQTQQSIMVACPAPSKNPGDEIRILAGRQEGLCCVGARRRVDSAGERSRRLAREWGLRCHDSTTKGAVTQRLDDLLIDIAQRKMLLKSAHGTSLASDKERRFWKVSQGGVV